jgi:nucleotidyltransferase-like protein
MNADAYLGTEQHQRVLRAVVSYYAPDPRVLAVLVFGSLSRSTWDRYSDLDLDIILVDGVSVAPVQELERLCAAFAPIGERAALIVPKRTDEGDVVLASLLQLSVRYHALASTSPNIVDSLHLLWGRIGEEDIRAVRRTSARWGGRTAGRSWRRWRCSATAACAPCSR